jgi:hypothetical protein
VQAVCTIDSGNFISHRSTSAPLSRHLLLTLPLSLSLSLSLCLYFTEKRQAGRARFPSAAMGTRGVYQGLVAERRGRASEEASEGSVGATALWFKVDGIPVPGGWSRFAGPPPASRPRGPRAPRKMRLRACRTVSRPGRRRPPDNYGRDGKFSTTPPLPPDPTPPRVGSSGLASPVTETPGKQPAS